VTRSIRIDEVTALDGPPMWHPVRLTLGVGAFGVNAYSAPKAGELVVEDHDEVSGAAVGHEELYVVVRGHARFAVDGEEVDAPAGTLVFVPEPASRRVAHAVVDDTAVLVVGGKPGEAFTPSAWERSGFAAALALRGEHERAMEHVAAVLRDHPDEGSALYNVACAEGVCGEREAALEHLLRSVELEPRAARWAQEDPDLASLRDDPAFPPAHD
jgi:mannose-6-phosphate isomerase-like protein (cupin superfamily)